MRYEVTGDPLYKVSFIFLNLMIRIYKSRKHQKNKQLNISHRKLEHFLWTLSILLMPMPLVEPLLVNSGKSSLLQFKEIIKALVNIN
jgi:hypothetical protein